MAETLNNETIKGERSMSRGFIAQYAAEAALQTPGVATLKPSWGVAIKEMLGVEHDGKGAHVVFHEDDEGAVTITIFPVVYYGMIIPEVAWSIQEKVKADVERYTSLIVESVHVHVCGVIAREEPAE